MTNLIFTKSFPFHMTCKRSYRTILYHTWYITHKAGITVENVHEYDKPLLAHMKPEKQVEYYLS